jgi:hypothetical protein
MTRTQNHDPAQPDPTLKHIYENCDVYDALHALDDLRLVIGRLKRQGPARSAMRKVLTSDGMSAATH